VSQWEREAIGERTSAAMQHKASVGEFTGGDAPYGYRLADDGTHLERVEGEQAVIALAREIRASGASLRAVAGKLAALGHVARTGKVFTAVQVARMLERDRIAA